MIQLHSPQFDEDDYDIVLSALKSNWISTGGPQVDQFEELFAKYVGSAYAISTMNGTVAIQLMLELEKRLLEISAKFEVIIPTISFIATANAVIHAGGVPVFFDVAKDDLNFDIGALDAFITKYYKKNDSENFWRSKSTDLPLLCIMPVHVMGFSCDMTKLTELCSRFQITLLEDAAEALGSFDADKKHFGLQGKMSAFSFNANKILTTGGGGMIITQDKKIAERLRHLCTTAKVDNLRYIHDEVGYNFRMVNILAALGCSQMKKLPQYLTRKREIFKRYQEIFAGTKVKVFDQAQGSPNYWLVNIVLKDFSTREKVLAYLQENGIGARPLWMPFHKQPCFSDLEQPQKFFPHADAIWERLLSLPSSPHLLDHDIDNIGKLIKTCLASGAH